MTTSNQQLPDGTLFAASDRMILVDDVQSVIAAGLQLATNQQQLIAMVTFKGRLNRRTERDDVTIALDATGAMQVLDTLLTTLEALKRHSGDHS